MTNTMTLSEIAEFVDWKAEWELACALRISDRQQSQDAINERDKWIVELIHDRDTANAKLKIATEALEEIVHIAREMVGTGTAVDNDAAWAWAVGLGATSDEAKQALARIREVV